MYADAHSIHAFMNANSEHSRLRQYYLHKADELYSSGDAKLLKKSNSGLKPRTLLSIADKIDIPLTRPKLKTGVLILGNVSAGKSTFINWFVQEAVQSVGMAIETTGFTFVIEGSASRRLNGESTLMLFPYLKDVAAMHNGFLDCLSTKTCRTAEGRLRLLNFIDTPGIVDEQNSYPFDMKEVISDLSHFADLIFVFIEPVGQASGGKLQEVIQLLDKQCSDKLRFILSKIDDIRTQGELYKILCQTTQSLTKRVKHRNRFDLIPIFVPGAKEGSYLLNEYETLSEFPANVLQSEKSGSSLSNSNRISDLLLELDKTIDTKVQNTIHKLTADCDLISRKIKRILNDNDHRRKKNELLQRSRVTHSVMQWILMILFIFFLTLSNDLVMNYHATVPQVALDSESHLSNIGLLLDTTRMTIFSGLVLLRSAIKSVPFGFFGILLFLALKFFLRVRSKGKIKELPVLTDWEITEFQKDLVFVTERGAEWWSIAQSYMSKQQQSLESSTTSSENDRKFSSACSESWESAAVLPAA